MSATGYDPDGKTWFDEPPETDAPVDEKDEPTYGPDKSRRLDGPTAPGADLPAITGKDPAGDSEGGTSTTAPADPADPTDAPSAGIDPCAGVPVKEWQSWTGSADADQFVLEPSEACGYVEPADMLRMTVAYQTAGPGARYLTDKQRSTAKALPKSGKFDGPAYLITAVPVPFATAVVVELDEMDVVVTIYHRGAQHSVKDVADTAARWAAQAQRAVTG